MPSVNNIFNYTQRTAGEFPHTSLGDMGFSATGGNNNTNKNEGLLKTVRRGVNRAEGPLHTGERSLLYGLQQVTGLSNQSMGVSELNSGHPDICTEATGSVELTTVDMSLSTLYLHELHHRQVRFNLKFNIAKTVIVFTFTNNLFALTFVFNLQIDQLWKI